MIYNALDEKYIGVCVRMLYIYTLLHLLFIFLFIEPYYILINLL